MNTGVTRNSLYEESLPFLAERPSPLLYSTAPSIFVTVAHLAGESTGPSGKCQTARRPSPPLATDQTSHILPKAGWHLKVWGRGILLPRWFSRLLGFSFPLVSCQEFHSTKSLRSPSLWHVYPGPNMAARVRVELATWWLWCIAPDMAMGWVDPGVVLGCVEFNQIWLVVKQHW